MASGSGNVIGLDFGGTKIIQPIGIHKATIVWLHDIGHKGSDSARFVGTLGLPHIKWICPTAPKRSVTCFGGMETTAWCDISEVSETVQDDLVSLYSTALFIASLLSSEPGNVMKGVGGIGLGAAEALYVASSYGCGLFPVNLKIVVGLNGWLPDLKSLQNNMAFSSGNANRAASLSILVTHGTSLDNHGITADVLPYQFAHKCFHSLLMAGFQIMFKNHKGEYKLNEVCEWLSQHLQL